MRGLLCIIFLLLLFAGSGCVAYNNICEGPTPGSHFVVGHQVYPIIGPYQTIWLMDSNGDLTKVKID